MNLKIKRFYNDDCTLGRLRYGNFHCFTLELPDLDNQTDISCIPAGTYEAVKYQSPSKGDVILLKGVPNRTYIEIHSGNYTSQILGCILVGDSIKDINNDGVPDVTNSVNTLKKLLSILPDSFKVEIE